MTAAVHPSGLVIVAALDGSVQAVSVTLLKGSHYEGLSAASTTDTPDGAIMGTWPSIQLTTLWHVHWTCPGTPVPIFGAPLVSESTVDRIGHCGLQTIDPVAPAAEGASVNRGEPPIGASSDLVLVAHVNGLVVARDMDSGKEVNKYVKAVVHKSYECIS